MTGYLVSSLWLVAVWVALWGELSPANVLSGVAVAAAVGITLSDAAPRPTRIVRPLRLLRFGAYFGFKIVEANLLVAWEVLTPRSRINQGIVAIPVHGVSDLVLTSVANAISLTPGTLTIEVRRHPPTLYVHVLHVRSIEQTRRDVLYLEYLLVRALHPDRSEALARLEADLGIASRRPEDRT